jgi:hypothetical protein
MFGALHIIYYSIWKNETNLCLVNNEAFSLNSIENVFVM